MKKTFISLMILSTALSFLTSCVKENMDTFGRYYIYMSKDTASVTLKDTLYVNGNDTLTKDSLVKSFGVYRSGISPTYPPVAVKLKIDSAYMDSMLTIYNNPLIPTASKSDKVLYFKNTIFVPTNCYELGTDMTIPGGEHVGIIPLKLNLTKIAKFKTTKVLVIPIALVSSSSDTIRSSKKRTMVQVKRNFVYKNITP